MITEKPILEVKNLRVSFNERVVVDGVDFDVYPGETLAIIGPNGAGKTTVFRAVLGFVPYNGKVRWKKKTKIGYIPQRVKIERDTPLSVREFFTLKRASRDHVSEALEKVGLKKEILREGLGVISSGELQRVLIAWALVGDPDILLFDEPTEGIDIGGEETIYHILHNLRARRGLAVVVISHDLNMVYKHAVKVLCLNRQKVCYGPPHEALNPKSLHALYGKEIGVYQHDHRRP